MKQHQRFNSDVEADQYLDRAIQAYLRDACRIFNLKIYQVELFYDGIDDTKQSLYKSGNRDRPLSQ